MPHHFPPSFLPFASGPFMRAFPRPRFVQQLCALAFPLLAIAACATLPFAIDGKATAPVLDGFGETTLVPSKANEAARRLFAQGMAQAYGFNHGEAIRAFKAALAQDPDCGLCAWGVAWQLGPNINSLDRGDLSEPIQYVGYAIAHSKGSSARDLALIQSLALRYGHSAGRAIAPPTADMCRTPGADKPADPLDFTYADHMQSLVARFPADPDVLTLYAEAEMVATRGEWWDPVTGKPAGRMGELASMLEAGLVKHPEHVGVNHYMIHAVDAVPVAERAIASADKLAKLAPKSPHLLHMPSHTYAQVGRYADATRVNQLAVAADEVMMLELTKQNFANTKDWRRHNTQFQWYAALMEGRGEFALETARTAAGRAKGEHEGHEYTRSMPMLTLLHLQRWDELLAEPMPTGDKGMATVLGEMARGIAMARKGQLEQARAALAKLKPKSDMLIAKHTGKEWGQRLVRSLASSSAAQLSAELAFAEQRTDDALKLQAEAVEAATFADRTEPPTLANGPLNRLGDMQLRAKRFAQAEQSFRTDLASHPKNGWALHGLAKALSAQGKQSQAQTAQRELTGSWVRADQQVRSIE
jgi:tetratricopeptide (TPR) repeat protein